MPRMYETLWFSVVVCWMNQELGLNIYIDICSMARLYFNVIGIFQLLNGNLSGRRWNCSSPSDIMQKEVVYRTSV